MARYFETGQGNMGKKYATSCRRWVHMRCDGSFLTVTRSPGSFRAIRQTIDNSNSRYGERKLLAFTEIASKSKLSSIL